MNSSTLQVVFAGLPIRALAINAMVGAMQFLGAQATPVPIIHLSIISSVDSSVIAGARIVGLNGAVVATTSTDGRFQLRRPSATIELTISALGFQLQRIVVGPTAPDSMWIILTAVVVGLPDLVVVTTDPLVRSGSSEWVVDGSATRLMPAAVEPDPFRVLRLVPAVSFSSVLSGRPLIRGVDADDAGYVIDGHEVINLFHIGRFFSAFPALGVGHLTVATQPTDLSIGRTTSGRIAIAGFDWSDEARSQIQYGLGAWSGRTGWQGDKVRGAFAGRTIQGALSGTADDGSSVKLNLWDGYGRIDVGPTDRPVSVTVFRSVDRVVDNDPDESLTGTPAGLDWGNLLVGASTRLIESKSLAVNVRASYSDHFENATGIPGRSTVLDVDNLIRRVGGAFDARAKLGQSATALRFGGELFGRTLRNRVVPQDTTRVPAIDVDREDIELAGFAGIETTIGVTTARIGARVDAMAGRAAFQPRLSLSVPLDERSWVSGGIGRSARLTHLLSDSRTEPKVAYYDLWLAANDTIPIATSDNVSLEIGWRTDHGAFRLGGFASHGRGQMDLAPEVTVQRGQESLVRIGDLRGWGLEAEVTVGDVSGRWTGQLSYALGWSERRWQEGWVPWINDRRQLLRASGLWRPHPKLALSATIDAGTGAPYTPIVGFDTSGGGLRTIYGVENSARGRFGVRLDLSAERTFSGPAGTDISLGLSVINLGLGDQAPREATIMGLEGGVPFGGSEPLFGAFPVPSLLLRVFF